MEIFQGEYSKRGMEMCKISVILPVFNAENSIARCLDSIINSKSFRNEYKNFFMGANYSVIRNFYLLLAEDDKKRVFDLIKNYIDNNKFLLSQRDFYKLAKCHTFEAFDVYINLEKLKFIEKIFSIRNAYDKKTKNIHLFGIKFCIKRKI